MDKCEWCGENFDPEEAEDYFESETLLSYSNLRKTLCGECAVKAIHSMIEDVYFEKCDQCGKIFDLITEESEFAGHFPWYNGTDLRRHWDLENKILCADCALDTCR